MRLRTRIMCTAYLSLSVKKVVIAYYLLGSQDALDEFAELAPEEAKKRLATIALKMDLNKDNFVTQDELTTWVLNSYVQVYLLMPVLCFFGGSERIPFFLEILFNCNSPC